MRLAILALVVGVSAGDWKVSCKTNNDCRSPSGKFSAIEQIMVTLQEANRSFSHSVHNNDPIALFFEENVQTNQWGGHLWTMQPTLPFNYTTKDALEAIMAMQKNKCNSCADAKAGKMAFNVWANSTTEQYGERPKGIPQDCLQINQINATKEEPHPPAAYFCPSKVTSPACAQLTPDGCLIAGLTWAPPQMNRTGVVPDNSKMIETINQAKKLLITEGPELNRTTLEVNGTQTPVFHADSVGEFDRLSNGDEDVEAAIFDLWFPQGLSAESIEKGFDYVAAGLTTIVTWEIRGEIKDAHGFVIGRYTFIG